MSRHANKVLDFKIGRSMKVSKVSMRITFLIAAFLLLPLLARAQSGCSDSPECPTPVLALAGAAGLLAANRFRK